jgi:type IV pilus assembly protein PilY1
MLTRIPSLRFRFGLTAVLLTMLGGLAPPFAAPVEAATATNGTVELSPTPPDETQAVGPNIVMTFDDSGSMQSNRLNDAPPFTTKANGSLIQSAYDWSGGPWRCAGVIDADQIDSTSKTLRALTMNGVYYNPNVTYTPPVNADSSSFAKADATLKSVWVDGISVNRPLSPATVVAAAYNNNPDLDLPSTGARTDLTGLYSTAQQSNTTYTTVWNAVFGGCPPGADSGSCQTNSLTKKNNTYTFYTWTQGGKLTAGTQCPNNKTCTTNQNSTTSNYTYYSVTTGTTTVTTVVTDNRWICSSGSAAGGGGGDMWTSTSPMDGAAHVMSDGTSVTYPNGGPYYYRLKKGVTVNLNQYGSPATTTDLAALYTTANWEPVPVPTAQYQNFANWYAYYRTRNQMARTSLSLVFGSLGATTETGGFGSSIRMAWQNLNTSNYKLPSTAIISELIDASSCSTVAASDASKNPKSVQSPTSTSTAPSCYRSAFFNWLFQVPASGGTPTRSAVNRAGTFFTRGKNNTDTSGDLTDPYWEPAAIDPVSNLAVGTSHELYCRQNFHMLVTDGLWNGGTDGPSTSDAGFTRASSSVTLPDGVKFPDPTSTGVTSIYSPVTDGGDTGYASLSDVAFNYWANNLRPDLYNPATNKTVPPYLPDQTTGVISSSSLSGSSVAATNVNSEIYFNPANDSATWPHMSEYLVGLGVNGQLNYSTDTDCTTDTTNTSDACALRKGISNSSGNIGWPTPNGTGGGIPANVDDTWHAALAGRGQYFNAGNPQSLIAQLTNILTNITARAAQPTVSAVNASVLTLGAITYNTGYSSVDWSGVLQAVTLNTDGTLGSVRWDAGLNLTDPTKTDPTTRNIFTVMMNSDGSVTAMPFESSSSFDTAETAGLTAPAATDTTNDTLANRVNYLRGVRTEETLNVMRPRSSLLGAIINAQPVYVSYPASGYNSSWPTGSNESQTGAQTYDNYVSTNAFRAGTLYVAANDGMLHAFDASLQCTAKDAGGNCISYSAAQAATAGYERWAYVPRAVYANLGNLTSKSSFKFAPTVDATPVTRDVFFSDNKWHTILVGGLRLGGRGVYALDISNPTGVTESAPNVLWEVDADTPAFDASNLGFTFGQPNVGRLANGKWVVLVPGGYFPDCSKSDHPANCVTIAAAANGYTSLFILDAETGALIREIKTPTTISGVTSYGLSSPVLGDYNNDQIDDVAYAGDLAGNLWRYDLSDTSPANWTVSLAYQPATQGVQPITVMPRLFADPATNRFMVVFGTGKFLGAGDNSSTTVQAVYGIRDELNSSGKPITVTPGTLLQQTLSETTITDSTSPNFGATLRTITSNPISNSYYGWYFSLLTTNGTTQTDAGERVVVTPAALFNTNTVVISTLIPGSSDPCNPSVVGAIMLIDATSGGAGQGLSSLGGVPYVGARVNNVRTSGTVPVTTTVGGGKTLFPGVTLTGTGGGGQALTGDAPIWRRRSWSEIHP